MQVIEASSLEFIILSTFNVVEWHLSSHLSTTVFNPYTVLTVASDPLYWYTAGLHGWALSRYTCWSSITEECEAIKIRDKKRFKGNLRFTSEDVDP